MFFYFLSIPFRILLAAIESLDRVLREFEFIYNLDEKIKLLREKGLSLREIAIIVNKSHEYVRKRLANYGNK